MPEQIGIVSRATGQPLRVVEINSEQAEQGLLKAGTPPFTAKAVSSTYEEVRSGKLAFVRDAVQKRKGGQPVTYVWWVESQRTRLA